MNRFLDQVVLDNTIRSYLYVAAIILLVLLFKKYMSKYIAGLLFRFVKRIAKGVDRASFVSLLMAPLQGFLIVLVTLLALGRLNFPGLFDITLYHTSARRIVESLSVIILIIAFIWLLLRIVDFISSILKRRADLTPDFTDNQLVVLFKDFFKVLIVINGVLMVLKFAFQFNIGSLITALSIGGAAVALATRESLENLIASFIIFFDKPFTVGDLVKLYSITGTVEKIGLRSTRIRTDQKTFVTVPNKQMVDSIMDNLSLRSQRRAFVQLEIHSETSHGQVRQLVQLVRELLQQKDLIENYSVFLVDINKNAFLVSIEFFTSPIPVADFNALRQDVNLAVIEMMESMNIRLSVRDAEPSTARE